MKKLCLKSLTILLVLVMLLSSMPLSSVRVAAEEVQDSSDETAESDVLSDYGLDISLDAISDYDPSNGDVENSPFGTVNIENFGYQEPVYLGVGGKNYIEASQKEEMCNADKGMVSAQTTALANGFTVSDTNSVIALSSITYSTTAVGDFSRDTRNNGVAVLFTTGTAGSDEIKIYFSVFDPTDTAAKPTCKLLSTISAGIIQKTEDLSTLLSVACGNYLMGYETDLKISPDEIVLHYPKAESGAITLATEVYALSDASANAWVGTKYWANIQSLSVDATGAMATLSMGDLNEDGYDDIIVVTSYGISRVKYDIKLSKASNAKVSVWYGGPSAKSASVELAGLYRAAGAVCDINNDGKSNLVVCGLTEYSVNDKAITLTEKAIALNVELQVDFYCETTNTVAASLYDTLNATLRQSPIVIKTVQMADDGSNYITGSQEDSANMVMYDGMFLAAKTCTKEMRFAGGSRSDYTVNGQVLVGAYSGMVYANPTAVSRDDIFMLAVRGSSTKVYNHSKAAAVTRTNLNDVNVTCFALPNTDYDTGKLRYDGWVLTFTEPSLKAILAATPTFGDFLPIDENYIVMGQTIYTTTSTVGKGEEHEWHGGLAVDYGKSGGVFSGSLRTGYQGSFSKQETTTKSLPFVATKETLAVVTTIPVEIYSYTLFVNLPDEGLVPYSYNIPVMHDEVYSTMTVKEYDKVAAKRGKEILSGNAVIHKDGDPASYTYTDEWITKTYGSDCGLQSSDDWIRTNYNAGSTGASIAVDITKEQAHGGYVDITLQWSAGPVKIGADLGYAGKDVWVSGNGTEYSCLVRNLPDEAADDGYGFKWKMKTYNARIDNLKVPVITYEIQDCSSNPRVPANVSARGYDAYDKDGNRIPANKITWEEFAGDKDLNISYAIMRKHPFTGAFSTVGTVPYGTTSFIDKKDLEFGTDYEYCVRAYKNLATAPNRYSIKSPTETAKTLSEHGALDVSVVADKVEVNVGKYASVGVNVAGDLTDRKIEYQWLRRLPNSYEWTDITDATSATLDITGATYVMDGAEYRCIVMETITLPDGKKDFIYTYSDVIKLTVK